MMTDERIEYFLDNETITDNEHLELVNHYFTADKRDWYKEVDGEKRWNQRKVTQFWKILRKHYMPFCKKNDLYYFRKFVFPTFETTIDPANLDVITHNGDFWEQDEKRVFSSAADFLGARFLSNVMLSEVTFQKLANLSYTVFSESANFQMCIFDNQLFMQKSIFKKHANFFKCHFKGHTLIKQAEFLHTASFQYSIFEEALQIEEVLFKNEAKFQGTRFNKAVFSDLKEAPKLDFSNTRLPKSLAMKRVNLTKVNFTQADLTEIQFKECDWGNVRSRIRLNGEKGIRKTKEGCRSLEELYRQLKMNFDNNKDWELSSKAYVSEMDMRKRRLFKEWNILYWFLYWFYSTFGGYTRHVFKPLGSLLATIVIFSLWYLRIECDLSKAFQRGLYGALPKLFTVTVPEEDMFCGNWLIVSNIEGILGATFLTFFILALRKRFR
ncbi:pentapeptide repeat-containing protein [Aquimarina algiphila]|uniref:Pentapeptide repeat-containing protein n=1 Tax=Aquimarina algiphila TaxID=2047982 RepID=A0A554VIF3_9FLAO|nr:pentapeptide repeat-containing protein [Aquimarina algiphila]TSE07421.1 pentapeptide repeat-containing protein [Aquimarina algiphila]